MRDTRTWKGPFAAIVAFAALLGFVAVNGCTGPSIAGGGGGSDTVNDGDNAADDGTGDNTDGGGDEGGDGTTDGGGGDENEFAGEPLGNSGNLNGKLATSASTRTSTTDPGAQQALPEFDDPANVCVRFRDLIGDPLLDENGVPIPEIPIEPDGSFSANNLPVGVDFTVCGDIEKDGDCEVESCVNIPTEDGGEEGTLDDVEVDPLTTLVLAKLRALLNENGITPDQLTISPVAVVARVVDAYQHLYEDAGIDQEITIVDLAAGEALEALFDTLVPEGAHAGINVVRSNLNLARSTDVNDIAVAAAEVFVLAGFPIVDLQDGLDLTGLEALPGVESQPAEAFFGSGAPPTDAAPRQESPGDEDDTDFTGLEVVPFAGRLVYFNVFSEPDRNFPFENNDVNGQAADKAQGPVLNDFILLQLAEMYASGGTITLAQLHEVLTSLEDGLGARLVFHVDDPNFDGPPLTVLHTVDGGVKAINLDRLFNALFNGGLTDFDHDDFGNVDGDIRALIAEYLGDTLAPEFGELFDGIATGRVGSTSELAQRIRMARAHLPFNRFGPSTIFVVADGDPFRDADATANPITVDAQVSPRGEVQGVSYNPTGQGNFYLGFTHATESDGIVHLIVRELGAPVRGPNGPARLNLNDEIMFAPVNGVPFVEFVSQNGTFYPGTHISVLRQDYEFESGDTSAFSDTPHEQLFVLATGFGEDAQPVFVDFNRETGEVVYNPGGHQLLMFLPDSDQTGLFALFNADTGRPASDRDPTDFFDGPPPPPEDFDDQFNENGGFNDVDDSFEPRPDDPNRDGEPDQPDGGGDGTDNAGGANDDGTNDADANDGGGEEGDGGNEGAGDGEGGQTQMAPPEMPDDGPMNPPMNQPGDGGAEPPLDGPPASGSFILVSIDDLIGLDIRLVDFAHVFGMDVPNPRYNADADPFFDDVNLNGMWDPGEPTAPFRPLLFNAEDWRATDLRLYYRRADNGAPVNFDNVDFESDTPRTLDGVDLIAREWLPRMNAFRFGRPNTAINLLTAFVPPEFFNGAFALNEDTQVDPFMAIAVTNLVMDQVLNVQADIDPDGMGPLPRRRGLVNADLFVPPINDPFLLFLNGLRSRLEFAELTPELP